MKFKIIFKRRMNTVAEVKGREVEKSCITLHDYEKIIETEQFLEKILGLRVHIMEDHNS